MNSKPILKLTGLENSLLGFLACVQKEIEHYCKIRKDRIEIFEKIKLDDKKIEKKKEIKSSNGRYFIREYWLKYYIPHSDSKGVYLFFNKKDKALYVGYSLDAIGNRVGRHVGKPKNNFPDLEFEEAQYVVSIPFERCPSLAPAYEAYLLHRYSFKYNKMLTAS